MSKATLLVTGFEPFGSVLENPSQRIVEHMAQRKDLPLVTALLPVDYKKAAQQIIGLIEKHDPQAVVMLGVGQSRDAIGLERIAVNINDAPLPDNAGELLQGKAIAEDGPVGYWSTLPMAAMFAAIEALDIPVKYSNHAGAYLCNHVFYSIRHYFEQQQVKIPAGFIHVPDMGDEAPAMPIETQIRAIEACLDVLMKHLQQVTLV